MAFSVYCVRCCKWMNYLATGWECPRCQAFLCVTKISDHDRSLFHFSYNPDPEEELPPEWEEALSGYL